VKNLAHTLASLVQLKRAGKTFLAKKNIYPVDGTDQDYYYHKFGTNALILESSHLNVDYKNIAEILQGFRPLWERLLEEALVGFRIRIKVLDVKGNLISAKVEFPEIKFFEKEEFLTDPKTGVFEKFFLEDGPRKIIFSKEGYFLQEIVVTPERGEGIHEVVVKEIR
jgi:hypothetical protein